jgi:hypothetical protein
MPSENYLNDFFPDIEITIRFTASLVFLFPFLIVIQVDKKYSDYETTIVYLKSLLNQSVL